MEQSTELHSLIGRIVKAEFEEDAARFAEFGAEEIEIAWSFDEIENLPGDSTSSDEIRDFRFLAEIKSVAESLQSISTIVSLTRSIKKTIGQMFKPKATLTAQDVVQLKEKWKSTLIEQGFKAAKAENITLAFSNELLLLVLQNSSEPKAADETPGSLPPTS